MVRKTPQHDKLWPAWPKILDDPTACQGNNENGCTLIVVTELQENPQIDTQRAAGSLV